MVHHFAIKIDSVRVAKWLTLLIRLSVTALVLSGSALRVAGMAEASRVPTSSHMEVEVLCKVRCVDASTSLVQEYEYV